MAPKVVVKRKTSSTLAVKTMNKATSKNTIKDPMAKPVPALKRPAASVLPVFKRPAASGQQEVFIKKTNNYKLTGGHICGNSVLDCEVRVELDSSSKKIDISKIKEKLRRLPKAIYPVVFSPDFLPEDFEPPSSSVQVMNSGRMKAWLKNVRSKGGVDIAIKQILQEEERGPAGRSITDEMKKVDAVINAFYSLGGDTFVVVQETTGTSKREVDDIESDTGGGAAGSDCDPREYEGYQKQIVSIAATVYRIVSGASMTSTSQLSLTCTGEVEWSC